MLKYKKIFIHDFPLTNSNSDLENYTRENLELDRAYILASCAKDRIETKEWLESLWIKYQPYAEPGFLDKLRSKNNSGFHTFSWQMYLATVFLDKGYPLVPNRGVGPDLQVAIDDKNIWVEAIVTTPGNDQTINATPASGDIYKFLDPRIARISNAFTQKYKKYKEKYLGKICSSNEPFIIAINGAYTNSSFGSRAIEATVYGRGNDMYKIKRDNSSSGRFYELKKCIEIKKEEKSVSIPTNYFCTDQYQEVNAIIYCEQNIINANNFGRAPEKELYFTINQNAKNDLSSFAVGNLIKREQNGEIARHFI